MEIKSKSSQINNSFSLYIHLKKNFKHTSILESMGEYHEDRSRYTIIGVIPEKILAGSNGQYYLTNCATNEKGLVDWTEVLSSWVNLQKYKHFDDCNILQTGIIGYIGYTEKNRFEKLSTSIIQDVFIPSVYLVKYSLLFFFDKKQEMGYWVYDNEYVKDETVNHIEKEFSEIANLDCVINYDSMTKFKPLTNADSMTTSHSSDNLNIPFLNEGTPDITSSSFRIKGTIKGDFEVNEYLEKIRKTIEYIKNGDIFQANITERFSAYYEGDAFELYKSLRDITPNPFFAYLDFDYPLISTSPERFIKINNRKISTNPIKGTIRCSKDGRDQREELENSHKNLAENIMIVDLMRNDIGRVCKQGSVEVTALCQIFKYNLMYHLESIIEGTLKNDTTMADVLKATYPGGSITGAPKIRAIEIIEELETHQRGPYTGTIGFFGVDGYVDTSIAIRIIYFDEEKLYFHAGGGIVVDSEPENEYNELLLKVESIKNAINKFTI